MAGPAPTAAVNSSAVWDDGSATETAELLLTMRDCALSVAAAEGGRALIPLAEGTMHLLQAAPSGMLDGGGGGGGGKRDCGALVGTTAARRRGWPSSTWAT